MRILKSKKSRLILIIVCVLLVALAVSLVGVWHYRSAASYETFTAGTESTGFLSVRVPRELQLKKGNGDGWRTIINGPVLGPRNLHITIEQEAVADLSTIEREGHLEVYATDLMKWLGLLDKCELQKAEDFLFFEYEIPMVYDRYSDNPTEYPGYGLIVVYRGPGQQGYIRFECHAHDKDTYREIFFNIAESIEFLE